MVFRRSGFSRVETLPLVMVNDTWIDSHRNIHDTGIGAGGSRARPWQRWNWRLRWSKSLEVLPAEVDESAPILATSP